MRREEEEEERTRMKAKGDLEMKEEEEIDEKEELGGPFVSAMPISMPHNKGAGFLRHGNIFTWPLLVLATIPTNMPPAACVAGR